MNIRNRWEDKLEPWGKLALTSRLVKVSSPILTKKFRSYKKNWIIFVSWEGIPVWIILYISPSCQILLNAISILRNATAVLCLILKLFVMWSIMLTSWVVVLCWARNPNISGLGVLDSLSWSTRRYLYTSDKVFRNDIDTWLMGFLAFLTGFGIIIISAIFQAWWKYSARTHPL